MKLIVGLGNPGNQYKKTLHNVGYQSIDALAAWLHLEQWKTKFFSTYIQSFYNGRPFLLLKPTTYMNLSGKAVLAAKQFYKLDLKNILILSDDLDLPPGKLRYRTDGGYGGHNGLKDIINQCGGQSFSRLKIGIGRPQTKNGVTNHVLNAPISADVKQVIEAAITSSTEYQLQFIQGVKIQIQPKP